MSQQFFKVRAWYPCKRTHFQFKIDYPPPPKKNLIEEIPKIVVSNFVKKYRSYDADFVSMLSETPIYMSIKNLSALLTVVYDDDNNYNT